MHAKPWVERKAARSRPRRISIHGINGDAMLPGGANGRDEVGEASSSRRIRQRLDRDPRVTPPLVRGDHDRL
jgi:hypothetical protein